jgi:serine/threonine protein kinase
MPHQTPLRSGDPRGVGRYRVAGRMVGIPTDDPIFVGTGPDGSEVAISFLRGDWSLDAAARDRFAAEAAVAKRVPPFCAARVLDAGYDGSDAYLVSEYVPGPSLLEVVAREGVRRAHDLEAIAVGMATGLASVHQAGLVHGSFGPEYVILSTADGTPRVVEFGITPPYGTATPSADMYAWAQTLAFAASGRPPVTAGDLEALPLHLRDVVELCLDPEASQRPAARAVVLSLLGGSEIPAGVLAEGSRRATRPVSTPPPGFDDTGPAGRSGEHSLRPGTDREHRSALALPAQSRAGQARGPQAGPGQSRSPAGPGRSHGGAARPAWSGRGLRAGLIAGAVVVIVALVAVLVTHVLGGSNSSNGRLSSETGRTVTSPPVSPSVSATPSPTPGPSTPASFAGSWTGQVQQPPTDTYDVSVRLRAGAGTGRIRYSGTGLSCSGELTLVTAASQKLTMTQDITKGSCENGNVTIELSSTGSSVQFVFSSNGPTASGTLSRS